MTKTLLITLTVLLLSLNTVIAKTEEVSADAYAFKEPMHIEIHIKSCKMIIYRTTDKGLERVKELPIATVRKGVYLYPKGLGRITNVILNPSWAPTRNTVEHINQKCRTAGLSDALQIGQVIKAGDPRNAMGTFKMLLSHNVPGKGQIYRIHGNNKPSSIGKRASSGCVRMDNKQGYILAENIKKRLNRQETVEVDFIDI